MSMLSYIFLVKKTDKVMAPPQNQPKKSWPCIPFVQPRIPVNIGNIWEKYQIGIVSTIFKNFTSKHSSYLLARHHTSLVNSIPTTQTQCTFKYWLLSRPLLRRVDRKRVMSLMGGSIAARVVVRSLSSVQKLKKTSFSTFKPPFTPIPTINISDLATSRSEVSKIYRNM